MRRIVVDIDDSLDRAFRIAILKKFDSKKGSLRKGVEEAIRLWLKNIEEEKET